MVVGTFSLVQKGQTSECSGCSIQWTQCNSGIWWGHCLWCKRVKPVNAVDAVYSGHSAIVVYGGDIVFGAKGQASGWSGSSMQWMQWMQYAVDAVE